MALTPEEKDFIAQNEAQLDTVLDALNVVKQFKEGDFLVAFYKQSEFSLSTRKTPVSNSYGAPRKYQVVAVCKHGVPYMKELSKKGKPVGRLLSSIHIDGDGGYETSYDFEVDPDYTDAIILDDQSNFDASNVLKDKSNTFKEIGQYNKTIKVDTDAKVLPIFLATVKVGDILWRSNTTSWSVVEIGAVPRNSSNRIGYSSIFMKVMTNKGKTLDICFNDVWGKALYTNRPRTYKELQDPKL